MSSTTVVAMGEGPRSFCDPRTCACRGTRPATGGNWVPAQSANLPRALRVSDVQKFLQAVFGSCRLDVSKVLRPACQLWVQIRCQDIWSKLVLTKCCVWPDHSGPVLFARAYRPKRCQQSVASCLPFGVQTPCLEFRAKTVLTKCCVLPASSGGSGPNLFARIASPKQL